MLAYQTNLQDIKKKKKLSLKLEHRISYAMHMQDDIASFEGVNEYKDNLGIFWSAYATTVGQIPMLKMWTHAPPLHTASFDAPKQSTPGYFPNDSHHLTPTPHLICPLITHPQLPAYIAPCINHVNPTATKNEVPRRTLTLWLCKRALASLQVGHLYSVKGKSQHSTRKHTLKEGKKMELTIERNVSPRSVHSEPKVSE